MNLFRKRDIDPEKVLISRNIVLDLRSAAQYSLRHIACSINIPLAELKESTDTCFTKYHLRDIIISICDALAIKLTREDKHRFHEMKSALLSFLEPEHAIRDKCKVSYAVEEISEREEQTHTYLSGPKMDALDSNIIQRNSLIRSDSENIIIEVEMENYNAFEHVPILDGKVLLLSEEKYQQVIKKNSEKESHEISRMHVAYSSQSRLATPVDLLKIVFDFCPTKEPDFPEFMQSANRSTSKGKRIQRWSEANEREEPEEESQVNANVVKKRRRDLVIGLIKKSDSLPRVASRVDVEKNFVEDDNTSCYEFTFQNSYVIQWNHIPVVFRNMTDEKLANLLQSTADCMEPYRHILRKQFGVLWGPFAVPAVLCFLVCVNKWTVLKSYNYLHKILPKKTFFSPILVRCARLLLSRFESKLSYYTYPSISLKVIATHQLSMEDPAETIALNKQLPNIRESFLLRKQLFKLLNEGRNPEAFSLIKLHPTLMYARTSYRNGDNTPLLTMLSSTRTAAIPSISDFKVVTDRLTVVMTSSSDRDVMYYAVVPGLEYIRFFLSQGALIDSCSAHSHRVPLQTAILCGEKLETLRELIAESTINHKDMDFRTPLHYVVTQNYPFPVKKEIIKEFVKAGANMYIEDYDRNTPMKLAMQYANEASLSENSRKDYREVVELFNQLTAMEGCNEENGSFAPFRDDITVTPYVDGEEYFAAVGAAMYFAKKTIYITDWWLSPQIELIRNPSLLPQGINASELHIFRLDKLLKEKTLTGVKIYILLWDNVEGAVAIKNGEAAEYLMRIDPENIQVLRHTANIIDSWSHHQKMVVVDSNYAFIGGLDLCFHRWDTNGHPITDENNLLFKGKDYYSTSFGVGDDLLNWSSDYPNLNRRKHCRLPWHDVSVSLDGMAAVDVAKNFVQRWNFIVQLRGLIKVDSLAFPGPNDVRIRPNPNISTSRCQITRSIALWSTGISKKESSIFNAMLTEIHKAETFIYIENQYFISIAGSKNLTDAQNNLKNIGDALVHRIQRAFNNQQPFKVVVVVPEYPEGDPGNDIFIQRVMYWQYQTIKYIQKQIKSFTRYTLESYSDYISIHSLHNHAVLDIPVSEQIYIHSKLMITDRAIICGSANINLRSLCGDRDSEIAAVIHNPTLANNLRKKLWQEHLGLEGDKITDNFFEDYKLWKEISQSNTKYYKNLFGKSCPVGEPKSSAEHRTAREQYYRHFGEISRKSPDHLARIIKDLQTNIQGHLVEYPLKYLKENLLSTSTYTALNPYNAVLKMAINRLDHIFQ